MVEANGKALIVPEALIVDINTVNAPFAITRRKHPWSKEMNANPNRNKNVTFILVGVRALVVKAGTQPKKLLSSI